jgi:hypothetical protein
MRTLAELRDVPDPAWPQIESLIVAAGDRVRPLPVDPDEAAATLVQLQVTARSALGAVALNTGGILIDHGWLRVLGGGPAPLNLALANGLDAVPHESPGRLLVAFDILGGKYSINGGSLPGPAGHVWYFAPDSLEWLSLELSYGDFVAWSMSDRFALFSESLRWHDWETEAESLQLDQGISVFPFPFTKEGRDLCKVSRRPVPIAELFTLWDELATELRGVPDGGQFKLRISDD